MAITMLRTSDSKNVRDLNSTKYEGRIVGLVDNRAVLFGDSIKEVLTALRKNYANRKIGITSYPKKEKIMAW